MASLRSLLLFVFLLLCSWEMHTEASSSLDVLFPNGTGVIRSDFPENFTFGALTLSVKHEGAEFADGKGENIWDVFARNDDATLDGSIPGMCGDSYNRYQDDIKLSVDMGMNAYRFSIAWSRIFPNGSGDVNQAAIAHYNELIDSSIEAGLEPHVTLWAQDHPQAINDDYGGPLTPRFINDFANYANTCFSAFGDRVKYWITQDEPNDYAAMAYATSQNPPGRCTTGGLYTCAEGNSSTEPYIVGHHLLLAHAAAARIYKEQYQVKQEGYIGIALWLKWFEPQSNSSEDSMASKRANDFVFGWFLNPIIYGDYPETMKSILGSRLPRFSEDESSSLLQSMDFLGLNLITAEYVTSGYPTGYTGYWGPDMGVDATGYDADGNKIGVGSANYAVPWCMRKGLDYVRVNYKNPPVYVTEIGWGMDNNTLDLTLDDSERVEFFMTYYDAMLDGLRDGVNLRGAFAWSLMDGFEFNMGMKVRFGLYFVNYDLQRYPRKSAFWFKAMLNSIDVHDKSK